MSIHVTTPLQTTTLETLLGKVLVVPRTGRQSRAIMKEMIWLFSTKVKIPRTHAMPCSLETRNKDKRTWSPARSMNTDEAWDLGPARHLGGDDSTPGTASASRLGLAEEWLGQERRLWLHR
ncbi:hypothetical protein J6590_068067 [Homalodisca vitripennis]|nr:hypothetical protein J6590_068067 [Homalodisca vitripennis]